MLTRGTGGEGRTNGSSQRSDPLLQRCAVDLAIREFVPFVEQGASVRNQLAPERPCRLGALGDLHEVT